MNYNLLEKLIYSPVVTGKEENIIQFIKTQMSPLCDEITVDKSGNIICTKKGKNPSKTVILDAHIDCVGFVVKKVYDEGFLEFEPLGGIDSRILPATEVVIYGKKVCDGVITSKPPHLMENKEDKIEIKDLLIDTGINDGTVKNIISVGDVASYKPAFSVMNSYISATHLDNKAGVYAVIETFERLKNVTCEYNLCAIFSAKEELGLNGAYFNKTDGNLVVVIDATHGQTPDEKSDETFPCGKGCAFGEGPNIDKYYLEKLKKVAEEKNIPYQTEVLEGSSGTNAWAYQTLKKGIPCILISFPLKYMHTPVETSSINDIDNLTDHLFEFLTQLKQDEIKDCELLSIGD